MIKVKSNRKGITLIEVTITLVILAVLLSAVFSFFSFGSTIFWKGERQYSVQAELRLASDFVADELRYAAEIELKNLTSEERDAILSQNIPVYDTYLLIEGENLVSINRFSKQIKHMGSGADANFTYNTENNTDCIKYTLTANDSTQLYSVDCEVLGMNIGLGAAGRVIGESPSSIVKYTSYADYTTSQIDVPVVSIDDRPEKVNTEKQVGLLFNKPISSVNTPDPTELHGNTVSVIYSNYELTLYVAGSGARKNDTVTLYVSFEDGDGDSTNNPTFAYTFTCVKSGSILKWTANE